MPHHELTTRTGSTRTGRTDMTTLAIAATLVVVGAATSSCATKPPPEPPQQAQLARAVTLPENAGTPPELPGAARAILKTRMASHVRDMSDLVSAIMILDYPVIDERARAIAADVSLSRPITGDATELASQIPENFFDLQDELRGRAKVLATAAADRSAFAVADAYGRVSETCVRCHAGFRPGRRAAAKALP